MSLRSRIDDAVFLWENERCEGAFLSALISVAATARRRFSDQKFGDREVFERFMTNAHSVRLSVEYRGKVYPIERILYKWLRCELVHEGGLPADIQFFEDGGKRLSVRAGGAPEFILKLSNSWFWHLVDSVVVAPENRSDFRGWILNREW